MRFQLFPQQRKVTKVVDVSRVSTWTQDTPVLPLVCVHKFTSPFIPEECFYFLQSNNRAEAANQSCVATQQRDTRDPRPRPPRSPLGVTPLGEARVRQKVAFLRLENRERPRDKETPRTTSK